MGMSEHINIVGSFTGSERGQAVIDKSAGALSPVVLYQGHSITFADRN